MEWNNLKNLTCPKCRSSLKKGKLFSCRECSFVISKGKLFDLVGEPLDVNKEADELLKRQG